MAKAIVPVEMPALPEGMTGWARSTHRAGTMYHAHALGSTACKSLHLDRWHSEALVNHGDMKYWGICPRCYAKVPKA